MLSPHPTARRSIYALEPKSNLTDQQLRDVVREAVKFTPTSFNMQQTRAVLVVGEAKNRVWDAVKEAKMRNETEDRTKATSDKIDRVFKSGYGTVLFFSDLSIVSNWSNQMPTYAEAFKVFDAQASGMLHYNVWTALEVEGHGANLQHFGEGSPGVQDGIRSALGLPESWHNTALLSFGLPAGPPRDKEFAPIDERVKFFDA